MSKIFTYLRTDTFRKNLLLAIAFFVVLFLGIYFGLGIYTKHNEAIPVPKVKGMIIEQAIDALDNAGLDYQIDSVYQMDAKPGLVIEQDPEPNFHVKSGRTIYLTIISKTAPEIDFPNIIDKTLIEASAILKNHGFRLGDTTYIADIAKDVVLDVKFAGQKLKPGRMVPKGSRIELVLGDGRGEDEINIPNLLGLTLTEAKFALQGVGLNVGVVQYQGTISDSTAARVISQTPDTTVGLVSLGTPINLSLSQQ
ncbi:MULTISPECIES: PASTA domain-containing protein [unclassified Sphingobacterium]|uniref:PASTA domain-containing protein n=1 Tax=unclassified Sphingobacterium TaxID=2609468 RepID=UPI0025F1ECBB|nr:MULTISPECIES: PASTA domain-containing protein [unclassified Sphingobacterium]